MMNLLAFTLGIVFALAGAAGVVALLGKLKLIRDVARDTDVDRRLLECEGAINALAMKLGEVSRAPQEDHSGSDPLALSGHVDGMEQG
jgi:hypothetical protein